MAPGLYEFRPMSADDMALLRGWLARPHVCTWWADEPAFQQFIATAGGRVLPMMGHNPQRASAA